MQLMQGVQNWATLPYAGPWSIVTVFCRQGKCLGGRAAGFAQEACFIFRKHSYALAPSELRGKGIVWRVTLTLSRRTPAPSELGGKGIVCSLFSCWFFYFLIVIVLVYVFFVFVRSLSIVILN